jgi:hypothetical protein
VTLILHKENLMSNSQRPQFNDSESPLLRLYLRKDANGRRGLDAAQFAAGEKLRADFERAMLSPRVTMAYQQPVSFSRSELGNSAAHISDTAMDRRERVHAALTAVGPELSGILWNVVCLAGGLEHAERSLALPSRSGKAILSLALDRLARHYGLKPRQRQYEIGAWHTEDYRAVIAAPPPSAHPT